MLIVGGNQSAGGYEVDNSCRFNNGSSDSLTRTTTGSVTNAKIATFSAWIKRSSQLNQNISIWGEYDDTNNRTEIGFNSTNDHFYIFGKNSGSTYVQAETNASFRDVSAWYHFVLAYDSTDGTSSNRVKIYVNGVQITSFASTTYPSLNTDLRLNSTSKDYAVGDSENSDHFWDGYMAEVLHIDGQALDPTSFGEFDADTGIWKPIDVSGLTFGTNGYYLDFENSAALGDDVSGNGNNFTVNNLTSIDQTTDTPTNNSATLNPLYKQDHAFSDGNLTYTSSASDWDSAPSTFGASSGKWYVEAKVTALGGGVTRTTLGICDERDANEVAESEFGLASYNNGDTVGYYGASANQVYKNGSVQSGTWSAFTTNDIIGMYVDLDNGYVYFSKNGSMQNSGDPTSGGSGTGGISITTGATYLFGVSGYGGGASQINFGSPPFSISSGNSDPNGYGNFEYDPQGYYALNTKNLSEYG